MKHLVKLPHGGWVNPLHVISVELVGESTEILLSVSDGEVEGPITFAGDQRDFLAGIINGDVVAGDQHPLS